MYITRVKLDNIRIIAEFEVNLSEADAPGWHVILGDNGTGKSTLVRAISLALIGKENALTPNIGWTTMIGDRDSNAKISLTLHGKANLDRWTGRGKTSTDAIKPYITFSRENSNAPTVNKFGGAHTKRTIWGHGNGWFSVAFGPFRRFRGGEREYDSLYYSFPRLAAHLSAFGEDADLSMALKWVEKNQFRALDGDQNAKRLIDSILNFINSSTLLPHAAQLTEVSPDGVMVDNGAFTQVPVEEMSDGYRSVLAMTFEIIRALEVAYGTDRLVRELDNKDGKIKLPGVILIDEIDAHLHPAWQHRIGHWFTDHFPKMQFIVTTHSPIICQAAERGTIWRLAAPGSEDPSGRVADTEYHRLVFGNILEALSTNYFGSNVSQSQTSQDKLYRLAVLNRKAMNGGLSTNEENERMELQKYLPSRASILLEK